MSTRTSRRWLVYMEHVGQKERRFFFSNINKHQPGLTDQWTDVRTSGTRDQVIAQLEATGHTLIDNPDPAYQE